MSMYYDSQVTIAKAKSKIFNGKDNWLWDALSTIYIYESPSLKCR